MSTLAEKQVVEGVEVRVLVSDLDSQAYGQALSAATLAWDIETTGLDWRADRIATVQIEADGAIFLVRMGDGVPTRLKRLLERAEMPKIMHHAMFDLRFMAHAWQATPRAVRCTKIASKLVHPDAPASAHALAALVQRHFGVRLDKDTRLSDWTVADLDADQVRYAADDVRFLKPLYDALAAELDRQGLLELRDRCYDHLATRVALELGGFGDVYDY
jgi:ribonuclease D